MGPAHLAPPFLKMQLTAHPLLESGSSSWPAPPSLSSTDVAHTHDAHAPFNDDGRVLSRVCIHLASGIGVSLVDSEPREVLYCSVQNCLLSQEATQGSVKVRPGPRRTLLFATVLLCMLIRAYAMHVCVTVCVVCLSVCVCVCVCVCVLSRLN